MRIQYKRHVNFTQEDNRLALRTRNKMKLEEYQRCYVKELMQAIIMKRELAIGAITSGPIELDEQRLRYWALVTVEVIGVIQLYSNVLSLIEKHTN